MTKSDLQDGDGLRMPVLLPDSNSASGYSIQYLSIEVDADLARVLDGCAAPPKPAPDAVREALDDLQSHHSSWRQIMEGVREHSARCNDSDDAAYIKHEIAALDRVVTALAAPVPSPDGAGDSEDVDLCPGGYWRGSDACRMCNCHLSPSPTVAAAPVATPQQVQEACALVADRAAQQDEEYAAKYPDEAHKFDQRAHRAKTIATSIRALIPPVASPTVTGDREILAETIHKARWPLDRQMAITPFADEDANGRAYCFRIADAILSLPVQPATSPDRESK